MGYEETTKLTIEKLRVLLAAEAMETDRLRLRPFLASDLPDLYEYLSQTEQRRLSGNCEVNSPDDARLVLQQFMDASRLQLSYAIVLKSEDKVIGNLSLGRYPFLDRDEVLRELRGVSLSYVLNERYWRRGYMTELLRALYPILFEKGELDYLQSGYFSFNAGSAALQRKLGMKLWTEACFAWNGEQIHTKEMILFRDEYERNGRFCS